MLQVSTTAAHKVNTLGTELSHGRLATHLELSLLDVDHHLSTSQTTLMTRITANTYRGFRKRESPEERALTHYESE